MEIVFWSMGDFLKLRDACGTWNCLHSDFIHSNNGVRCYRNLILIIISIYNSSSLSKCLHWRGISREKVDLFKNVNFIFLFFLQGNQVRCQIVSVIMLPFPSVHLLLWSVWHFTRSNADGEIYLLMETPHLPICQLCLSRYRLLWLYSGQIVEAELETSRPWRFSHALGGEWQIKASLWQTALEYVDEDLGGTRVLTSLVPFTKSHSRDGVPYLHSCDSGPSLGPIPALSLLCCLAPLWEATTLGHWWAPSPSSNSLTPSPQEWAQALTRTYWVHGHFIPWVL